MIIFERLVCRQKIALAGTSLIVAFAATQTTSVHAQPTTAPAAAPSNSGGGDPRPAFEEGRALMQSQRFAEAAVKFEQSLAARPTIGALLNLGDCYEKVGRYASAVRAFDQAKDMATAAHDKAREQEGEVRGTHLRGILSTLTVHGTPSSGNKPEGLVVSTGGKDIATDVPVPLDGGEHIIKITARCRAPSEMRVNLGLRGDAHEITVPSLAPSTDDPACKTDGAGTSARVHRDTTITNPTPTTKPDGGGSTWSTRKTIAVAVGAVGVGGLAVGTIFGLSALSMKSDLNDRCSSYPTGCPFEQKTELDQKHADAESSATISTIAFVVGAALLAGGVVLFFTAPTPSTSAAASPRRRPGLITF